jgi:hypothetical protein
MDLHDGPGTGGPANGREPEEDGPAATKPRASADDASSAGTISVEMRGQTRDLPAGKDYTGDGRPDAVAETPDGQVVVFADTEDNESGAATPDGKADEVYVVDKATGRAVAAAHLDPDSGTWVDSADPDGPSEADRAGGPEVVKVEPDAGGASVALTSASADYKAEEAGVVDREPGSGGPDLDTAASPTTTALDGGSMTVEIDGRTQALPVERDYTGDGLPDAATETADGRVIVFADTEDNETGTAGPDGRADEAWIVDKQTGRVVAAAHIDPRTGEWVDGPGADVSPSTDSPSTDSPSTDSPTADGVDH